jgi:hypothetical protein
MRQINPFSFPFRIRFSQCLTVPSPWFRAGLFSRLFPRPKPWPPGDRFVARHPAYPESHLFWWVHPSGSGPIRLRQVDRPLPGRGRIQRWRPAVFPIPAFESAFGQAFHPSRCAGFVLAAPGLHDLRHAQRFGLVLRAQQRGKRGQRFRLVRRIGGEDHFDEWIPGHRIAQGNGQGRGIPGGQLTGEWVLMEANTFWPLS